jgi:hypothetical protein
MTKEKETKRHPCKEICQFVLFDKELKTNICSINIECPGKTCNFKAFNKKEVKKYLASLGEKENAPHKS